MIDLVVDDKPVLDAWEQMERSKENFFTNHAKREQELDEAINSLNITLDEAEANRTKNTEAIKELMASLKSM